MKKILLSGIAAIGLSGVAVAADLPVKAVAPAAPVSMWEVEVGGRYWYSSGRMRYTLGDPFTAGQTNSQLTYKGLDSHGGEGFARFDHSSGFFLKGFLGGGKLSKGTLIDEDYPPAAVPYSATSSDIQKGDMWYGTADLGYNFWQTPAYKIGAFVGYNHFRESANGFGCVQIATNPGICGAPIPTSVLVLTETQTWDAARLGMNGVFTLTPGLKLTVDAALLPYVHLGAFDNHWLRPDINPLPQAGHGWGYQFEGILAYDVTRNFSVGVGGRYWYAETTSGSTQFPFFLGTGALIPSSPTKFSTERYGGFLQASYKFGDPPVVAKY